MNTEDTRTTGIDAHVEDVIRAAANVIIDPVLALLQDDPHSWSTRPCGTCRAVQSITGRPFGCYLYAARRAESQKSNGEKSNA